MITVAYFITPHGFGHASRATAVMQGLQRKAPDTRFLVFTTVPDWFFADAGLNDIEYISLEHDVGLVQTTPFVEDIPATLQRLDNIYPYSAKLVQKTVDQLQKEPVDLVICDISPLGIVAARQCGIPSLLIENFTWDWIYQPFSNDYPQFKEFIGHLESLFPLADFHIQAEPICERITNTPKLEQLIAREFKTAPSIIRQHLGIAEQEKMVLVSFGGIRDQFDSLEFLHPYNAVFVMGGGSDEIERKQNVISLPHQSTFYHPDLVHAADIIIGKAGYSTLAEVTLAGKPFAFISRKANVESAVLAEYIHQHLPSIEISQQEYISRNWIEKLPEILKLQPTNPAMVNGADLVADYIFDEIL